MERIVFEVGPTEILFELFQYEMEQQQQQQQQQPQSGNSEDDTNNNNGRAELELTPEIWRKMLDRIVGAAKQLDMDAEDNKSTTMSNSNSSSSSLLASRSVNDLRKSNQSTLVACAGGFREFLEDSI